MSIGTVVLAGLLITLPLLILAAAIFLLAKSQDKLAGSETGVLYRLLMQKHQEDDSDYL